MCIITYNIYERAYRNHEPWICVHSFYLTLRSGYVWLMNQTILLIQVLYGALDYKQTVSNKWVSIIIVL